MKTKDYSPGGFKNRKGVLLAVAFSSFVFAETAHANTSAGTVLRNSVTVNYDDAAGTPQPAETDSVDVTVNLVPAVTWGAAPPDQTTNSNSPLPGAYIITLTNGGNGSDSFAITDNTVDAGTCSAGSLSAESFGFITPVTLGATVSSGAATFNSPLPGQSTIPVSNLVAADFILDDRVIIGGNPYVVVSASADGNGTTPDSLVVTGDATTDVAGAGVQIGEQIDFSYGGSGNAGTMSVATATGCAHNHELVATGSDQSALGNGQATDTVNGWQTFVVFSALSVDKFVRNTGANGNPSSLPDASYAGNDYWIAGVSGKPGDILEYLVVMTNSSAGKATDVVFNDTLPSFTLYVGNSTAVDTNGDGTFDTTAGGEDETAADGGIIVQSGSSLTVYAGINGDDSVPTGGEILAPVLPATTVVSAVRYQVTID